MKNIITLLILAFLFSCKKDKPQANLVPETTKPAILEEFGFKLNNYKVINDTIKSGENFSEILDRHHIAYPKVLEIVNKIKDT
ncbi:MAG: M23 family peptidase, partial [Lutibacter sp.]